MYNKPQPSVFLHVLLKENIKKGPFGRLEKRNPSPPGVVSGRLAFLSRKTTLEQRPGTTVHHWLNLWAIVTKHQSLDTPLGIGLCLPAEEAQSKSRGCQHGQVQVRASSWLHPQKAERE